MNCKKCDENLKALPLSAFISIIHRQYIHFLNKSLEIYGIGAAQVPILSYLFKNKYTCQDELANFYKINKGSIARSIRKLEIKGLVARQINKENRRKHIISLTKSGAEIAQKILEIDKTWDDKVYSTINVPKKDVEKTLEEITEICLNINEELLKKEENNA